MDNIKMKDIPGYETYYAATEDGHIWSYFKQDFLKELNETAGYLRVNLYKNGVRKQWQIHKLIALTFIPNPENKPVVDHIDRDRKNNCVSNLRWATLSENAQNKTLIEEKERIKNLIEKAKRKNSKQIECRDKINHDILINTFPSAKEAARQMFNKESCQSLISACARGEKPSAYGYWWNYLE